MKAGIIILAAGSSSRLGRPKQMLDIHGEALLLRTVNAAIEAEAGTVAVVLGSNEKEHRKILTGLPIEIVYNEQWEKGMGHTLKTGLQYLLAKDPMVEAIIVLVCDQPLLSVKNIKNLVVKHEESKKPVVASRYSKIPGVPVLFHKSYFATLMSLPDDQGARKIIQQNPSDVFGVDFPGGEIDLDTPEDYNAFKNRKTHDQ